MGEESSTGAMPWIERLQIERRETLARFAGDAALKARAAVAVALEQGIGSFLVEYGKRNENPLPLVMQELSQIPEAHFADVELIAAVSEQLALHGIIPDESDAVVCDIEIRALPAITREKVRGWYIEVSGKIES